VDHERFPTDEHYFHMEEEEFNKLLMVVK
jgi:hypothetical protein